MKCFRIVIAMAMGLTALIPAQANAVESIESIMAMLPDQPACLGRPIDDRAAWDPLAKSESGQHAIAAAAALLDKPIEAFRRDLYMEFFRTGVRYQFEPYNHRRWQHLRKLTIGELLENRGRFIPAIQRDIQSLCDDPAWTLPSRDREQVVIDGKRNYVDLNVARDGYDMAMTRSLLGDRLDESTRNLIQDNLQRRVIDPTFYAIRHPDEEPIRRDHWWRRTTNNWNAVCTAGTTGVILATVESKRDRAEAVVAALDNMTHYLAGFTADGYCSEGLGYWGFGFGHFVVLRQMLLEQTDGKIDLLDNDRAKAAARFPLNIHILDDVWPAIADAKVDAKPLDDLMMYLGWKDSLKQPDFSIGDRLCAKLINLFSPAAGAQPQGAADNLIRTYFNDGGVLIVRPNDKTQRRFAAALKAGHNAENHNHNDVGSFVVVLDGHPLVLDPGAQVYSADTFKHSKRYRFAIMNSYGHSVPVIDGQLQQPGAAARARIITTDFTDDVDTFAIDLTACYMDPNLSSVQRTWTYDRRGAGMLKMTDHVDLKSPGSFETALVGVADWRMDDTGVLYVRDTSGAALRIEVACDHAYKLIAEKIDNPGHFEPVRIGIRLTEAVRQAQITLTIRPVEAAEAAGARAMPIAGHVLRIDSPVRATLGGNAEEVDTAPGDPVYQQDFSSAASIKDFVFASPGHWRRVKVGDRWALEHSDAATDKSYEPPYRSPYNVALIDGLKVGSFTLEYDAQQTSGESVYRGRGISSRWPRDAIFFSEFTFRFRSYPLISYSEECAIGPTPADAER